jgi:hypothetical protein
MSEDFTPFPFAWDGEAMHPITPYWAKKADERFCIGEKYLLLEHHERSAATHAHYFAALHDAWLNLPEALASEFPTVDVLRARALIATGFRNEQDFVASSKAEALRLAAFLRPIDTYALTVVNGATVTRLTAKSQSMRAMGKAEFQRSKEAVLSYVWELVGVDPATGNKEAGQAA